MDVENLIEIEEEKKENVKVKTPSTGIWTPTNLSNKEKANGSFVSKRSNDSAILQGVQFNFMSLQGRITSDMRAKASNLRHEKLSDFEKLRD